MPQNIDISRYKAVVFDMDGTLLDTRIDYDKMTQLVFLEMIRMGVPKDVLDHSGSAKFNIDSGANYLISEGRKNDVPTMERNINGKAREIEMKNVDEARAIPGSIHLIQRLRERGFKVGVLTRGSRDYAEYVLGRCGILPLIDSMVCRDDYSEKEAKPSAHAMYNIAKSLRVGTEEILYIGDHGYDYICARDSGANFIAVLTGSYDRDDWQEIGENILILGSVADMISMLDKN